jgi:outer membrane protein assembly factor BamA
MMKRLLQIGHTFFAIALLAPGALGAAPLGLGAPQSGDLNTREETPREQNAPEEPPAAVTTSESPPGKMLLLEKVVVSGNDRLEDEDILDAVELSPGDAIDAAVLESGHDRLMDAHPIISSADFFTTPGTTRGAVVLEIDIVERSSLSIETGYGYHDVHGWFLTLVGLRFDGLFNTASNLRVGLRYGFNLMYLGAEWEHPPRKDGGLGANVRFSFSSEDRRFFGYGAPVDSGGANTYGWSEGSWNEFRQNIERTGAEASALYGLGRTRFSFGARIQSVRPEKTFFDVERDGDRELEDFPDVLKSDIDETLITGLFFRMTRDTRDHVVYPRSGSFALLSVEANNTLLGGDETFTKTVLDLRKLADLGNDRVLLGRLNAGIVTSGTPYYEKFTIGGIHSIRGFRELSLSPTAGDDGFWTAGCELRFPLIRSFQEPPRLSGLLFFDVGQGWQRGSTFLTDNLQSAAGYGVRLRLPWLGVLGLDVGIPLSEGRTEDKFRIHGSLGFSY